MKRKALRQTLQRLFRKGVLTFMALAVLTGPVYAQAPVPARGPVDVARPGDELRLTYNGGPGTFDLLLQDYSEKTGRTMLMAPKLPQPNITLQSQGPLTLDEYLQAIETVLNMHGVVLIPEGERFLRVVPVADARREHMTIQEELGAEPLPELGGMVSQVIQLKYLDPVEANKAIEFLKHTYGVVNVFPATASLLVTDTPANVNRIVQVLELIDVPVIAREEVKVVPILYAKASDIKSKLQEIVAEAQKDQEKSTVPRAKPSGSPGVLTKTPAGVIRAVPDPGAEPSANLETIMEQAERGVIQGKVQIVADDRTNVLIIITRPENMSFFENIIRVLDVETEPNVMVKIIRLEYSDAETLESTLNALIGKTDKVQKPKGAEGAEGDEAREGAVRRDQALREYIARVESSKPDAGKLKSAVGELSADNIKILSDKRTNALIIMATRADLATIEEIINDMDVMLSQVLIETVILQVNLSDTRETGVDWIQRSLIGYRENALGGRSPVVAFAGSGGGGDMAPRDATAFQSPSGFPADPAAGLHYYLRLFDINVDMVVRAVATDSRTKILSSPVILTTDNNEATIDVATEQYFYKGKRYVGASGGDPIYEDDVERKSVGVSLKVIPRINAKRFVVMEIEQTIDNVSGEQVINNTAWPIVTSRKISADVAVRSGDTIVLGGLVLSSETDSSSKIPFLGSIPLLGIPFRSKGEDEQRNEVIVFLTPYVLDTPEEIETDARRRQEALSMDGMWKRGWSDSRLADEPQQRGPFGRGSDAVREGTQRTLPVELPAEPIEMEPEVPEPEIVEPKVAEPEVAEPEVAEPEIAEPELPKPEIAEPELPKPEIAEPESPEPEAPEPEVVEPGSLPVAAAPDNLVVPEEPQASGAETEAETGAVKEPPQDPLSQLDPETRKMISRGERRWKRTLERADQRIEEYDGGAGDENR